MNVHEDTKAAIGRIAHKGVVGTAWLVAPRWILTCLHVIQDAYGDRDARFDVEVEFPSSKVVLFADYDPTRTDISLDVALLELRVPAIHANPVAVIDVPSGLHFLRWSTWGFPALDPNGIVISGSVSDTSVKLGNSAAGLQLDALQGARCEMGGLSGAPILLESRACGFVSDAPPGMSARAIYGTRLREVFARFSAELGPLSRLPLADYWRMLATERGFNGLQPNLAPDLQAGLEALWDRHGKVGVDVKTFHKLLLVERIAPTLFADAFASLAQGLAAQIHNWLVRQVDKHARKSRAASASPGRMDLDRTLQDAVALARAEGRSVITAGEYLYALFADEKSGTIRSLREAVDPSVKLGNGFDVVLENVRRRLVQAGQSTASDVSQLDFEKDS